jgi:hypothetical protein
MPVRSRGSPQRTLHNLTAIIAAFFVLALVQTGVVLTGYWPVLGPDGVLAGPDSYMRLLRVEHWMRSGGWRDTGFPLSNAPYGEVLHWTRPFDVLLLLGARALGAVMTLREGLFWWGAAIGPVLQGLTVLALSWATRSILSNRAFVFLILLFAIQPAVRAVYGVARPDHHAFLALLFTVGFALVLRGFAGPGRLRWFGSAGVVTGLAIWVSVEGAAPAVVTLGVLMCLWIRQGGWYVQGVFWYLVGAVVVLSIALPLERPVSDLMSQEFDKVSIVHWSLLAMAAAACGLCAVATRGTGLQTRRWSGPWTGRARFAGAAFIGAAPLGLALVAFPRFFGGPFVDVDPRLNSIWLRHIDEVQPLMGADLAIYLGPAFLAILYLVWRLWRQVKPSQRDAALADRERAVYMLTLLVLFTPLAAYQARWSIYPSIVAMAPWVLFLCDAFRYDGALKLRNGIRIPLRVPFFLAVLSTPVAAGAVGIVLTNGFNPPPGENPTEEARVTCPWPRIAPLLRALEPPGGPPPILLSFIHQGPEVMYRTGFRVVGTPYHRNAKGILDTHVVLTAKDPKAARKILRSRGVDYLVFCRQSGESNFYRAMNRKVLYQRIYKHDAPDWLRERRLPENISADFQLFQMVK